MQTNGKLVVKTLAGKNGSFTVADLETSAGIFKVKQRGLEQFEEGTYDGVFLISKIYLSSYPWKGMTMTEMRADIADLEVFRLSLSREESESPMEVLQSMQEAEADAQAIENQHPSPSQQDHTKSEPNAPDDISDISQVQEKINDRLPVKLDPTSHRVFFSEARSLLRSSGYGFDFVKQTWLPK